MAYLILVIVFFIFLAHVLAKKKGLDAKFWVIMGGLLGPLVIPVILLLKSKNKDSEES